MEKRFPPISPKLPRLIHGCDYNPDQWLHRPEILEEDLRLMKLAGCNAVSLGIFSWALVEPEEGRFCFDWLDRIMDDLARERIFVILATPSASRPAWLARRYPEVLRVGSDRRRNLYGLRHNHCYTSPLYRAKAGRINRELAERYRDHPALIMWHVSNEYGGECHCPLCQEAFRAWLRRRYAGSLERLNLAWWTSFWGHSFSDWEQIESPAPHGEPLMQGLNLDWKRFVTDQTVEFMKAEIAPLREITPHVPVTTNMMGAYPGLNYRKLAPEIDVASWDSYPCWHAAGEAARSPRRRAGGDWQVAADTAFAHDLMRSLKGGRPFMLMESTPTFSSWHRVHKLKRPGMHRLSSLLAVAHGSDTVQYFQWRKGRGGYEKFHGAVVDHAGSEHTRVFREVAETGRTLRLLDEITGSTVNAETAIIYDWENLWTLEANPGTLPESGRGYLDTCRSHHYPFWAAGVPVDVVGMEEDLAGYRLVVAPMLYMVRPGVAERLERFVGGGGVLVATYWSGIADESDLCFLGGFPGPLRKLLGIRSEEIEGLYRGEKNLLVTKAGNSLGLRGSYQAGDFCDLIHAESARVLAEFGRDFYRGRPALTENGFGSGKAYYIAARGEPRFLRDFYAALTARIGIRRVLDKSLPQGVCAQVRCDGEREYVFLLNFNRRERRVNLGRGAFLDKLSGEPLSGRILLPGYGLRILQRPRSGGRRPGTLHDQR